MSPAAGGDRPSTDRADRTMLRRLVGDRMSAPFGRTRPTRGTAKSAAALVE
jgi:hypothetical protein